MKDQVKHLKGKLEAKTPKPPSNHTTEQQTNKKAKQNPHLMAAKRVSLSYCLKRWNLKNIHWCEELIEREVPVGLVCEWCVPGAPGWASLQMKDLWSRWEAGCGLGSQEDRKALAVLGDVCVPALVTFCLQYLKRREGTQLSVLVLHVSPTYRCSYLCLSTSRPVQEWWVHLTARYHTKYKTLQSPLLIWQTRFHPFAQTCIPWLGEGELERVIV